MVCPFKDAVDIDALKIKPKLRPDPTVGSQITFYDHTFVWTDEHLSPTELNPWRQRGDMIIDAFFQQYFDQLNDGDDTYELIQDFVVENNSGSASTMTFSQYIQQKPIWFDAGKFSAGQTFFLKHTSLILTSIFYYTLLLGYGFQQLNDVLNKTNYLSSNDLKLTYRRLVETLQMIAKLVCGDSERFDETFSDVVRVRLLHGLVRHRITRNDHNSRLNDIPINQEDSLITLLGFSFSVLYCIEDRLGITIAEEQKLAYLHLWRYVGWLIGIEERYLVYLDSYRSAKIISESIFYHYYFPSTISKHMAHHSLMSSYVHGPFPFSYQFSAGIVQILMGPELSHGLNLDEPKIDRLHYYGIQLLFKLFRVFHWLGTFESNRWDRWISMRNKQRLSYLIYTNLDYELKNYSLFKSEKSSFPILQSVPLKDCSCHYYQKKQHQIIQTNDFSLIRFKRPVSFMKLLEEPLILVFALMIIRCWFILMISYQ